MFGVIFINLKEKSTPSKVQSATSAYKSSEMILNVIVVLYGHLCFTSFHPPNGYFYIFCRTFGPTLLHFLSDIHKKCLIVRQVRWISTALHLCPMAFHPDLQTITTAFPTVSQEPQWAGLVPCLPVRLLFKSTKHILPGLVNSVYMSHCCHD